MTTPCERPMRENILDESTRLFAARGFEGTSLGRIAREVGISKPSLLYHFTSKASLHRAVLDGVFEHWSRELPRILKLASSGDERWRALTQAVVDFFLDDPDRARLLLREMLDHPAELRALFEEHVLPWLDVLSTYIERGQARGEIPADLDPHAYLLHTVHHIISGIALSQVFANLYTTPTDQSEQARAARHITELLRITRASLFLPSPGDLTP